MKRREAIQRALDMHPDLPGVGRLCQELLADLTGMPVTCKSPPPERRLGRSWWRRRER